ncbi:MAG: hypothetical protein IKZ82_05715 [Clostridia bacterium]|nr:hypothetical protein [Clostridia bacterium]MBR5948128.1 hypothetical protein [Clostridia bacterium]
MKKILMVILALLMVVSLVACGKTNNNNNSQGNNNSANPTGGGSQSGNNSGSNGQSGNTTPEAAKLTGKLNLINLDDRDSSVLRGVRINGLSVGSADGFNSREYSLTDVRCIFELNEWIEFYPDTDATYGIKVWILKHRDDQEYYNTCQFSDLMPNFANFCDLHYPEDVEDPGNWYWGNFYLHEDGCEPGYYDFVFTYEGKAIATLLTRFYKDGEISAKSDAELEALMHE